MVRMPIRDLKDTVEVEKKCAEANGPVFVTKNGYGRLVVMDIDYYEQTMRKIYEAKQINVGLEDVESDRVIDGNVAMQRMKEKYGI